MKFEIKYNGHEIAARKKLLKEGFKTADELAVMVSPDVENEINKHYEAIECGEDWLLVLKSEMKQFNEIISWIER